MNVVSLFSGAGGMDLGFQMAGHKVVWANDIYADAVSTYRTNIGDHIHEGPIENLSPAQRTDIVIGGFPCQGFSVANRQRHDGDQRNALYLQFLRIVEETKPLYFVAENVKGILSFQKGAAFRRILDDFSALGFEVSYALLNAADYGVPQRRERVFIFGRDRSRARPVVFPPRPTHAKRDLAKGSGLAEWVSVGDALAGLPTPSPECLIPNHQDCSAYKLRFNGHLGHRRIDPALPAPTVTARGDDRGGVVVLHHPSNERRVSPREAATIQSFPMDYKFCGNRTSAYRQIANAVPPLLARAVAMCIPAERDKSVADPDSTAVASGRSIIRPHGSQLSLPVIL